MRRLLLLAGLLLAASCLVATLDRNRGTIVRAWESWRYPPSKPLPGPMGEAMLRERAVVRGREIAREHERVRARLAAAREEGFDVGWLEPKLEEALERARRGEHRRAGMLLNLVEVRLPGKGERVVPAGAQDGVAPDGGPDLKGRPVAAPGRRARRKR